MSERFPWENWSLGFDLDIEEVQKAEALGFSEYWTGEHHAIPYEATADPLLMLSKASAVTERIKLAPGIIQAPIHDPFKTAERLAQVDHLSHGRLIYGIGGGTVPELDLFNVDREEKRERMTEFIDIVETYHTAEGKISYDGDFWQYEDREIMMQPYQRPHPTIAIPGATSPYSFELSAWEGYIPLSISYTMTHGSENPEYHSLVEQAETMRQAARDAGNDPADVFDRWRVFREVYVAESREQAIEDIREGATETYLNFLRDNAGFGPMMKTDPDMDDDEVTLEYLIDESPWIVGSPEDCIRQIEALQDEIGDFGHMVITSRKSWMPTDKWYRSLERFARYVMPAFKERAQPASTPY
jgi:limonene 1,2-monooxygenase